jgi:predicted nucleotide-binding protein
MPAAFSPLSCRGDSSDSAYPKEEPQMPKPTVFIGSSTEGLKIAKAVQFQLQQSADVQIWYEGLFELGLGTLEGLLNIVENYDFAILVATPDDLTESRGTTASTPRDNVMVELGFFVARLGRSRAFLLRDDSADMRLPSDFAGVSHAKYRHDLAQTSPIGAVGPACLLIDGAITKLGTRLMGGKRYSELLGELTDNDVRAVLYLEAHGNVRPRMLHQHLSPTEPLMLGTLDKFAIRTIRLTEFGILRMVGGSEIELTESGRAFLAEARLRKERKYAKLLKA